MSKEELQILARLCQITKNGVEEATLQSLDVNYSQEQARHRLYLAKNPQIVENFQVKLGEKSLTLLGNTIALGKAIMIVPEVTIDIRKLEDDLKKGEEPVIVQILSDPGRAVRILYEKWSRQPVRKDG